MKSQFDFRCRMSEFGGPETIEECIQAVAIGQNGVFGLSCQRLQSLDCVLHREVVTNLRTAAVDCWLWTADWFLPYFHPMILLAAAILANLVIAVCFKLFKRLDVDHFTAIVVNYWASAILGSILGGHVPLISYDPTTVEWAPYALALSVFFIVGFTITALSVRFAGMAVTTAMQKMSLLVSAGYALLFFGEVFDIYKLMGMVMGVAAIILITRSERNFESEKHPVRLLLLPVGTLLFSGIIESVLYYVHAKKLAIHGDIAFTTYAFSVAACVGTIVVIYRAAKGLHKITRNDLLGGLALGIPNFFTIYLILTLLNNGFPGSVLYPVLNILVLALTAITGYYFFHEKLSKGKMIGIGIALLAILLISVSSY